MQCREDILTREVTNPRSRDWSPSLEFNSCGGCTPPERGIKPKTKRLMSPRRPGSVSCPVLQGLLDTLDYFHLFLWVHLQELLEISGMCALWISVLEIFQLMTLRMRQVATPLCQPGVRRTRCRAPSRFLFFSHWVWDPSILERTVVKRFVCGKSPKCQRGTGRDVILQPLCPKATNLFPVSAFPSALRSCRVHAITYVKAWPVPLPDIWQDHYSSRIWEGAGYNLLIRREENLTDSLEASLRPCSK